MIRSLTSSQLYILRRCHGGLRVWETGQQLRDLMAELEVMRQLELVRFDDNCGYALTSKGEICFVKLSKTPLGASRRLPERPRT